MEIAKQIAGFSPAEADDLRKAIGKKIHALMASLKEKFLEGCAQSGRTPAVAKQLWEDMEQAQDYSFNKAHAACYALIAYRTAWLRAHHPHEYMAALISSVMNTKDRVPFYVNACHELGIEVLPPDVNFSQCDFAVVEGKIRFGLNAVKNVGDTAARAIVARARRAGRSRRSGTSPSASTRRSRTSARSSRSSSAARSTRPARRARGCSRRSSRRSRGAAATQADRLLGQGSIFDLGEEPTRSRPSADRRPTSSRRTSCSGSRRRRSASTSPSIR